jgi:Arylsulfotransferase (ASST)
MKNLLKTFALLYLVSLLAFFAGVYVTISESWPYQEIMDLYLFTQGDPTEDTTIAEKALNDLDIDPARQLRPYLPANYDSFEPLTVPGLRERRDKPLVYQSAAAEKGYRLIHGVLDFENNLHGAILLDSDGKLVHTWQLTERHLDWVTASDLNKFPHGITILPDGSVVFAFTRSSAIQRIDACGKPVWAVKGKFHHAVTPQDEDFVWSLRNDDGNSPFLDHIVKLDVHSGELIRSFTLEDIIRANPDLSIFHVQQMRSHDKLIMDGFHANDVEPLPAALAPTFPDFRKGDLLISFRNNSLVFVLDPETLEVKWWRTGNWRYQHDPDWQPDGTITIYNNNLPDSNIAPKKDSPRHYSKILSIAPSTFKTKTLVDGQAFDFLSEFRGKHQVLPGGSILITSTNQGRVLEVDRNGEVVFEFINQYSSSDGEVLPVSEAIFLPADYFDVDAFSKCEENTLP